MESKRREGDIVLPAAHDLIEQSLDADSVSDEDLRRYCEQLKFENDVLRAELDLFAKKYPASVSRRSTISSEQNS